MASEPQGPQGGGFEPDWCQRLGLQRGSCPPWCRQEDRIWIAPSGKKPQGTTELPVSKKGKDVSTTFPSLAPCTLRVRLGGRHSGSATSCFCAGPCTHSVQDVNRLLCFHNFWSCGIWWFLFLVVCEDQVFRVSGLGGWCFRDANDGPATFCPSGYAFGAPPSTRRSSPRWFMALLRVPLMACANNALVRTTSDVVAVIFSAFAVLLALRGGLSAFSLHTAVFFSLQSLCLMHTGKPTGVAVSHCITRFQTQLILTTCQIRYHNQLWDHRSTGQL